MSDRRSQILDILAKMIDDALAQPRSWHVYRLASIDLNLSRRLAASPVFDAGMISGLTYKLRDDSSLLLQAALERGLLDFFPPPDKNHKVFACDLFRAITGKTPPGLVFGSDPRSDTAWQRRWRKSANEVKALRKITKQMSTLEFDWKMAVSRDQFETAKWLASNFPVLDCMIIDAFLAACYGDTVPYAKWFYETYAEKFDWKVLFPKIRSFNTALHTSLLEDRAELTLWLADIFDLHHDVDYYGYRIFLPLFALNNVFAVQWLLNKYKPSLENIFLPSKGLDPAVAVAMMERFGRLKMARILEEFYHITPAKDIPANVLAESILAQPPPPTPKLSRTPEEWREKANIVTEEWF